MTVVERRSISSGISIPAASNSRFKMKVVAWKPFSLQETNAGLRVAEDDRSRSILKRERLELEDAVLLTPLVRGGAGARTQLEYGWNGGASAERAIDVANGSPAVA
jgi:hypothetical protein